MNTKVTEAQKARTIREWSQIAGEDMRLEFDTIYDPVYAFGSELGCLRLFYKMKVGRAEFSKNLNTWFYCNK